jgi:hypothetical protein
MRIEFPGEDISSAEVYSRVISNGYTRFASCKALALAPPRPGHARTAAACVLVSSSRHDNGVLQGPLYSTVCREKKFPAAARPRNCEARVLPGILQGPRVNLTQPDPFLDPKGKTLLVRSVQRTLVRSSASCYLNLHLFCKGESNRGQFLGHYFHLYCSIQ